MNENNYTMPWRRQQKQKKKKTPKLKWSNKKSFCNYDSNKNGKNFGRGGYSFKIKARNNYHGR